MKTPSLGRVWRFPGALTQLHSMTQFLQYILLVKVEHCMEWDQQKKMVTT